MQGTGWSPFMLDSSASHLHVSLETEEQVQELPKVAVKTICSVRSHQRVSRLSRLSGSRYSSLLSTVQAADDCSLSKHQHLSAVYPLLLQSAQKQLALCSYRFGASVFAGLGAAA